MNHMEAVKALRADTTTHYNCAQAVFLPYAMEQGLTQEQAYQITLHFGGGMGIGATCGAITGGLMALGLMGGDRQAATCFLQGIRGKCCATDCATLLKASVQEGIERKVHCDDLVFAAVELLDDLI